MIDFGTKGRRLGRGDPLGRYRIGKRLTQRLRASPFRLGRSAGLGRKSAPFWRGLVAAPRRHIARAYRSPSAPSKRAPQISNHSPSESSSAQIGGQGGVGLAPDPGEYDPPCRLLLPHQNAKEQSHGNAVFVLIRSANERRNCIPPPPPIFGT